MKMRSIIAKNEGKIDQDENCNMSNIKRENNKGAGEGNDLTPLSIKIPDDLYRAYQRCTWILINETDRGQLEIMEEMVRDFLVKHGC